MRKVTRQTSKAGLRDLSSDVAMKALQTYAQYRQGHVTRLLAGQGDRKFAASLCARRGQMRPDVTLALRRLQGFRFIGLTDQWELSICLLHVMHGSQPCAPAEMLNSRPTKSDSYEGARTAEPLANFRDEADETIYEAARSRFEEDLAKWQVSESLCKELKCTSESWADSERC